MKRYYSTLLILFLVVELFSQHLGAYNDYRGRFFIFDKGKHQKVEDLEVQSYSIGGSCILYVNAQGNLKLYEDGRVTKLESGGVSKYSATDHLAVYSIFEKLKVIENGVPVTLSHRCPVYEVQDSLVVFYDKNMESLRVYYNENTVDIESGLVGIPAYHLRSGDNIVAYISPRTNNFQVYYKGENHTLLEHVDRISYKAGKDIVAYINTLDNSFNAFFKGETYRLEDFSPASYKMGDGFVAYVDDMGIFKVFSEHGTQEVSSFSPESYICEDNLLLFTEYDYLKLYTAGEVYELEPYIPRNYKIDWNTVVYVDNTNRIWVFANGEKKFLLNDAVKDFEIHRDLIMLNLKMDRNLIYYQGKEYEGVSY